MMHKLRELLITVLILSSIASAQSVSVGTTFDVATGTISQSPQYGGTFDLAAGVSQSYVAVSTKAQDFLVYNKSGTNLQTEAMFTFASHITGLTYSSGVGFPETQILYDTIHSRWYIVFQGAGPGNDIFCVSAADDPRDPAGIYSGGGTPGGYKCGSPTQKKNTTDGTFVSGCSATSNSGDINQVIGYDANGVYIHSDIICASFGTSSPVNGTITSIPIAGVQWSGAGTIDWTNAQVVKNLPDRVYPVVDRNASKGATDPMFFLSRCDSTGNNCEVQNANPGVTIYVGSRYGTWSGNTFTLNSLVLTATTDTYSMLAGNPYELQVTANVGLRLTNGTNFRMYYNVQNGNTLYAAVGSPVNLSLKTHNKIYWYVIDVTTPGTPSITAHGSIDQSGSSISEFNVAAGLDSNGNMIIANNEMGASEELSLAASWRTSGGTVSNSPTVIFAGPGPSFTCTLGTILHNAPDTYYGWGNTLALAPDPSDMTKMWFFGGYAGSTADCNWRVRAVQFSVVGAVTYYLPLRH